MNLLQRIRELIKRIPTRLRHATKLEILGMIAIGLLLLNALFDVDISVTRKPLLNTLMGKATNQVPSRQASALSAQQQANDSPAANGEPVPINPELENKVLPVDGVLMPVVWKDLGKRMIEAGVIDQQKFEALYQQRGGMSPQMKEMLADANSERIIITADNAQFLLNLFWALGLGNKNDVLDKGEMQDPQYGGAGRFASTGGWSLAKGDAMEHYSKHPFVKLTDTQQALVEKVSKNIYRPCCGNSTHFPDCNHGMAMLGLLELMASQGASEQDMYKTALAVNAYWFPDTYLTLASYFDKQGADWSTINAQAILGSQFSSGPGFRQILSQITPPSQSRGGGGCGV